MNEPKMQKFEDNGVLASVTSPDGVMIMIVRPEDFVILEHDKNKTDYCMVLDDRIYFSSRAKYDYVIPHFAHLPSKK